MRVFGIDPGSRHTGFAVVEGVGSELKLLSCGTVSPKEGISLGERLVAIHSQLVDVLQRTTPDAVSVEEVFHAHNVHSALVLGHARGVALLAAASRNIPVHEYAAAEIKRAVAGNGRAEKDQVQRMVALLIGVKAPGDEHACDAIAAAICHLHRARRPLPKAQAVFEKGTAKSALRKLGRSVVVRGAKKPRVPGIFGRGR